ncbi:MAG: ABC transporter permease [Lachnospiraceae bacterium]|nr:ABC transporter permease [Lachnospiraceae bacterium]
MSKGFKDTKKVCSFTLKQLIKTKGFAAATILFAIALFAIPIIICVLDAKPDKESKIKNICISDNLGFEAIDYNYLKSEDVYKNVTIEVQKELSEKEIKKIVKEDESGNTVGVKIDNDGKEISINIFLSKNGDVTEGDGEDLGTMLQGYIQQAKYSNGDFSEEQLAVVLSPVMVGINTLGQGEENIGTTLVKMFLPMMLGLVIYMMVLIYGQSISKSMMTEKSSRILELMLTTVSSSSLIAGKIAGMIIGAMIQIVLWCVSLVLGYKAGVMAGGMVQEGYKTGLSDLIELLKNNNVAEAFTIPAIIIAFLVVVLGFIMYCSLAGLCGSFVQKSEDMGPTMMIFQYAIVIGFFIPYFGTLMENKDLMTVAGYCPLSIPFQLPADILVGTVTITQGLIELGILVIFTAIIVLAAGKVYRATVFYNGSRPKIKDIINIIKG